MRKPINFQSNALQNSMSIEHKPEPHVVRIERVGFDLDIAINRLTVKVIKICFWFACKYGINSIKTTSEQSRVICDIIQVLDLILV